MMTTSLFPAAFDAWETAEAMPSVTKVKPTVWRLRRGARWVTAKSGGVWDRSCS
jgi:hypothetical protein